MDKKTKELQKLAKTIYQNKLENLTENQRKELETHIIAKENMDNRDPFESIKMILEEANKLEAKHLVKKSS